MAMLPSQRRGDGLCAAPLRDADGAVAALPMTKGEVIRHPGGVAAVRNPVFRRLGCRRHAGMVRRAFHPIAPRRRCGAVASIVVECILLCLSGVSRHDDGLPPPPGWHLCGWCWWSPHVADTPVGEIRGYAQRQPLAGWRKCPPPVIVSSGGGWRTRLLKLWHKKRDAEAPLCFRTL